MRTIFKVVRCGLAVYGAGMLIYRIREAIDKYEPKTNATRVYDDFDSNHIWKVRSYSSESLMKCYLMLQAKIKEDPNNTLSVRELINIVGSQKYVNLDGINKINREDPLIDKYGWTINDFDQSFEEDINGRAVLVIGKPFYIAEITSPIVEEED